MVDEQKALRDVDRFILEHAELLKCTDILVCLSCTDNWRFDILPTYKANRKDARKPTLLPAIVEHIRESYKCYERPMLEADDVMGILSTSKKLVLGKKVILSIDKDMQTIPGWFFNPGTDTTKARLISEYDANWFHMYQTLAGDTVDNYKGCPGVGDEHARAVLEGCVTVDEMWKAVVACYESKKLTEADALVQAQVARICRNIDYDFEQKKVKPWQAPK